MNFEVPHSVEAEQSVLGAILFDETALDDVITILRPDDFYVSKHRTIYQTMIDLYNANKPVSVVEVIAKLKDRRQLEEAGGIEYINSLAASVPSTTYVTSHAEIIIEKAVRRKAIQTAKKITEMAVLSDFENVDEFVDAVESEALSIRPHRQNRLIGMMDNFEELIESAIEKKDEHIESEFIPTWFPSLDEFTGGLQKGALIVLAARPSAGKTAFSLAVTMHVSKLGIGPVLFFSQEMTEMQLKRRMLSAVTGIPLKKIIRRKVHISEYERLADAAKEFEKMDIKFDQTSHISIEYVMSVARRIKRERGQIGLIVIDYLGLMDVNERKGEPRAMAIGRTTRRAKQLAKELNCPILMIAQMNRAIEQRATKRPQLSDLRESGDIEADADIVAFLHQDLERAEVEDGYPVMFVELIIAKGRDVGIADFGFKFRAHIQRFEEVGKKHG